MCVYVHLTSINTFSVTWLSKIAETQIVKPELKLLRSLSTNYHEENNLDKDRR